jgi:hypothetical protein
LHSYISTVKQTPRIPLLPTLKFSKKHGSTSPVLYGDNNPPSPPPPPPYLPNKKFALFKSSSRTTYGSYEDDVEVAIALSVADTEEFSVITKTNENGDNLHKMKYSVLLQCILHRHNFYIYTVLNTPFQSDFNFFRFF